MAARPARCMQRACDLKLDNILMAASNRVLLLSAILVLLVDQVDQVDLTAQEGLEFLHGYRAINRVANRSYCLTGSVIYRGITEIWPRC